MYYSQVNDARSKLHEADAKITAGMSEAEAKIHHLKLDAERAGKETRKELHDTVDKFDKTVERKAAEAKSGISSWFGFGK